MKISKSSKAFGPFPVDPEGRPDFWGKMFGSWGQTVKDSDSWDSDDLKLTVEALRGTWQNLCLYDVNTEGEWTDFLKLLEEVRGTDFKVFAVVQSETTVSTGNRWFCRDGIPEKCTEGGDCVAEADGTAPATIDWHSRWQCDNDFILAWLDAWKRAAETLSALSLYYTNLVGMAIDFDDLEQIESADKPNCVFGNTLTVDQVKEIAAACASVNPRFEFWPVFGINKLGRVVGKGHILGHNYGVHMQPGDYASVELEFEVGRSFLGLSPIVTFFHCAEHGSGWDDLEKSVLIDGQPTTADGWPQLLSDGDSVLFDQISLGQLDSGTHHLKFQLAPTVPENDGTGNNWWRIWAVKIMQPVLSVLTGAVPSGLGALPLSVTYEQIPIKKTTYMTNATDTNYDAPAQGMGFCTGESINNGSSRWSEGTVLPDDPELGRIRGRLVAAPNDSYLITEHVAGIAPYTGTTETTPITDALHEAYDGLLAALKDELAAAGRFSWETNEILAPVAVSRQTAPSWELPSGSVLAPKLMIIHWAMEDAKEIDTSLLKDWLEKDAARADYTVVMNYPLGLYFLDSQKGIFAEQDPATYPCLVTDPTFVAFWRGRQEGIKGWYHKWVSNKVLKSSTATSMSIKIRDNCAYGGNKALRKRVSASTPYYMYVCEPCADEKTTDCHDIVVDNPAGQTIELSLTLEGLGVGDNPTCCAFTVSTDDPKLAGDESECFDFQPGVHPDVTEVYDSVRTKFWALRIGRLG